MLNNIFIYIRYRPQTNILVNTIYTLEFVYHFPYLYLINSFMQYWKIQIKLTWTIHLSRYYLCWPIFKIILSNNCVFVGKSVQIDCSQVEK